MLRVTSIWIFFVCIYIVKADYIAAVFEYNPANSTSPNETVTTNLEEYIRQIEKAKTENAKIIVFPEYGLTGFFSDPTPYAIQIPNVNEGPTFQNQWLQKLSNAAVGNAIYVVVNLLEKSKNAKNETVYYNTNIMFDKNGKIGAKYRKKNLYAEPWLTKGDLDVKQSIFSTDFGVTFGMVICYDMFFYNPSRSILVNSTVTDVILSTAWYNTLPFYHSLSYHLAYAQANKINLLASNLNSFEDGMSGSGIYGAKGTVFSHFFTASSVSKLVIAEVKNTAEDDFQTFGFDIDTNRQNLSTFPVSRVFDSERYQFQDVKLLENGTVQEKVCHGSFCCRFNISIGSVQNSSEVFKLMAYSGPVHLKEETIPSARICSLLACESTDRKTCGTKIAKSTTQFEKIAVTSDVLIGQEDFFQPMYLTTDLMPILSTNYSSRVENSRAFLSLNTTSREQNVLVFGIYGSGGADLSFSCFGLALMVVLGYLIH